MKKLLSVLCFLFLALSLFSCNKDAGATDQTTSPETTLSAEEIQRQKDKAVLDQFVAAENRISDAKQINYDSTCKIVCKFDGTETIYNDSSTYKKNITDDKSELLYLSTVNTHGISLNATLAYADGNAYYKDGIIALKSAMGYDEFDKFIEEKFLDISLEYNNFKEFTYEELNQKYIGTFKDIDDNGSQYFKEIFINYIGWDAESIISFVVDDIVYTSELNKQGYLENEKISLDTTVQVKMPETGETKTLNCKYYLSVVLNSIDQNVEILLPADKDTYIPTNDISTSSEYGEKILDYINGTKGTFEMSKTSSIDISGAAKYSYKNELSIKANYSDLLIFSSKGKLNNNGEITNYTEDFNGSVYYFTDDKGKKSYPLTKDDIDDYISNELRYVIPITSFSKIDCGKAPEGTIMSVSVDEAYSEDIAYAVVYKLYKEPDKAWAQVKEVKCNEITFKAYYDADNDISSIRIDADITISFSDGNINAKYSFESKYISRDPAGTGTNV